MSNITRLLEIMARLRDKEKGCPWDMEQNFASIAPHTIEEAYEVADAIERGNMSDLKEELGDLLLQVIFHSQMASETKLFTFEDVVNAICDKLVRRHPHVFGDATVNTAGEQVEAWEKIKLLEKPDNHDQGVLDGVALGLPALLRAVKLQKKAAKVGFDWPALAPVFAKLTEELAELHEAIEQKHTSGYKEEIGDVLFVCANIARHLNVEPEEALRAANAKFERRFGYIEQQFKFRGEPLKSASLQELDELWDQAKLVERSSKTGT